MRKNIKSTKKILAWTLGCIVLALFVFLTIETATSGATLANLEKKETAFAQENADLQDAIVRASSLNGFEKRSLELGFVKPTKILYITTTEEVAKLP
jgi:hypothetical protein